MSTKAAPKVTKCVVIGYDFSSDELFAVGEYPNLALAKAAMMDRALESLGDHLRDDEEDYAERKKPDDEKKSSDPVEKQEEAPEFLWVAKLGYNRVRVIKQGFPNTGILYQIDTIP